MFCSVSVFVNVLSVSCWKRMVLHTKGCNGQSVTRERNRRHALVTVYLSHHAIIEENVRNYIVIPLTDFEFF